MSYEKIKNISIKPEGVFITSACNNVRPLYYSRWKSENLTKILNEFGLDSVEIEILKLYEEGNFQNGTNKYTKALKVLKFVFGEEYFKFNWQNHESIYGSEERKAEEDLRKSEDFKKLLLKALKYKIPKTRFIVTKTQNDTKYYGKFCPSCVKWSYNKEYATKFYFKKETEHIINKSFPQFKDNWEIIEI